MPILAVSAKKPHANSKLGFNCKLVRDKVFVTSVVRSGIFGNSDLKYGQEILRINSTSLQKISYEELVSVLDSLPSGDVTLIVRSEAPMNEGVLFKTTTYRDPRQGGTRIKGQMKSRIDDMPQILRDAAVPQDKWWLIYTLVMEELLPESLSCIQSNHVYNRDMKSYLKVQKSNYTNTGLEKAIHMKGTQTGILHNNMTLIAMAVKDRINSILAKYHVTAVLAYESIELPQYPGQKSPNSMTIAVGFNFYSMDYLTVCAVPTTSAIDVDFSVEAPTVVAPVAVPTAPTLDC
jgi:hypothetical protein